MSPAILPPPPRRSQTAHWLRFLLPLLLLSLLIAALGSIGYRYLSDEIHRETQRTLTVIVEQKRQQIEEELAEIRRDGRLYFSPHSQLENRFEQWLASGRQDRQQLEKMRAHLQEILDLRAWSGLTLFDRHGESIVAVGQAGTPQAAQRIADIVAQPRIELIDLHLSADGQAEYALLAPIGKPGAAPDGVVHINWRASQRLYPLVEAWPVPTRTAETYLVRREGDGVRFLTPLRHRPDAALHLTLGLDRAQLAAARAARGEHGIIEGGHDYRDVPVLAYAAPIAGTPWLMIAEIDELEAYAGIRTLSWTLALIVGLLLLSLYSAAFVFWRKDRQTRELAALRALREAELRFRVIFEQAPLGIALLDADSGQITEANQRFAEIVDRPPAALTGLDPGAITHPDDIATSSEHFSDLRAGRCAFYRINKRYLRPDGSTVWTSLTCAPMRVSREEAPRYLAIVEDISERREIEERLRLASAAAEAANAAKSEFLGHMSHEIRTPMNAMLGLAQVLEREPLADNQRDMVQRIRSAGQSLLTILNDILDLSKIEAGQLRLEQRPFDPNAQLAHLDSLMGQVARSKGLGLRIMQPLDLPSLLVGDGLRLEQVLFNLVGNAIKFTEQGEVSILVEIIAADEDSIRLRFNVRDTGIGIGGDALSRLFTPFMQADSGISRRFGGTGLGLSICKRLVELMGGSIGARSEPGLGSTFWFELPFARAAAGSEPVAARPQPAPGDGPRLCGAHFLVVDDSAMNRDLVERALHLEGATATLAADGQQALQLLATQSTRFDAVLMDVQMPVMDGLSATRAIREELGLSGLPIIAFTAGVREEEQARARAAGANDILAKPMDLDEMAQLLAQWVRPGDDSPSAGGTEASHAAAPDAATAGGISSIAGGRDDFPAIAGVDRDKAAKRVGGDREMYLSLLEMFFDDNAEAVQQVRQELASGASDAAARRLHTLRSNAGFICAMAIMELAGLLEKAIDNGEHDLDERLDTLAGMIASLHADWQRSCASAPP